MRSRHLLAPARAYVDATSGRAAAAVTALGSLMRQARVFHPAGVAFHAAVTVEPGDRQRGIALLDRFARYEAIVRLSRGAGLPEQLPDVRGLAVHILDAHGPGRHQDLLMVTAASDLPGLRQLLVPTPGYLWPRYSTLLPYRGGGRLLLFGARPVAEAGLQLRTFGDLEQALADARLRFALGVADLTGRWEQWGTLEAGQKLTPAEEESLRFDPFRSGPDLTPAGVFNIVRRRAYHASQDARPTPLDTDPSLTTHEAG